MAAVIWIAGAMLMTAAIYVGVRILGDFTLFSIQRIEVRGNVRTPVETLTQTLGIMTGQSLYGEKVAELADRARALPWIKSAKVSRRIPDTVVVDVEEWDPAFLVRLDRLYYMTRDAHVINAPLSMGMDFAVVTGLTWARLEGPGSDRERLLTVLELVGKGAFLDRVDEIHYDPALGITIYAEGQKPYGAYMGFGDFEEKFSRLGRMRRTLLKKGQYAVSADISYEDRIVARLATLDAAGQQGAGR